MNELLKYDKETKHRKKRNKKTIKKSNHKHNYIEIMGTGFSTINKDRKIAFKFQKCTICDKLVKVGFFSIPSSRGSSQILIRYDNVKKHFPEIEEMEIGDELI